MYGATSPREGSEVGASSVMKSSDGERAAVERERERSACRECRRGDMNGIEGTREWV